LGVVASLVVAAAPTTSKAQSSSVTLTALQPLAFGTMVPGVVEAVAVTDAWRRAAVRLDGSGQTLIRFVLPATLSDGKGNTIPLTFGTTSAGYTTPKQASVSTFDPQTGTKINLKSAGGSATVYLGGTAMPAAKERAGTYSGTVVIVVSPPNV
jgi:hypothetical protein